MAAIDIFTPFITVETNKNRVKVGQENNPMDMIFFENLSWACRISISWNFDYLILIRHCS
jgi:hypothetical protein